MYPDIRGKHWMEKGTGEEYKFDFIVGYDALTVDEQNNSSRCFLHKRLADWFKEE
jgi:hypothetical protein